MKRNVRLMCVVVWLIGFSIAVWFTFTGQVGRHPGTACVTPQSVWRARVTISIVVLGIGVCASPVTYLADNQYPHTATENEKRILQRYPKVVCVEEWQGTLSLETG